MPVDKDEREAHARELRARRVAVSEQRQAGEKQRVALAERREGNKEQLIGLRKQGLSQRDTNEQQRIALAQRRQEFRERVSSEQGRGSFPPSRLAIPKTSTGTGQSQKVIAIVWVAGIAVISWQEMKLNKRAPDPDRFIGWGVAMGSLSMVSPIISTELANVFAVGLIIGLMIFRKPKAHDFPGGQGRGLPNNLGPTTAAPVTPYQPGQTVPNPPPFGSGHWFLDTFNKSVDWLPWYTAGQVKQMNLTNTTDGGPLVPPSGSPNWRYDPSADNWVDISKLSPSNPLYNPGKAPSLTGH